MYQHAILGQLRNPQPPMFADVIRSHFYLEREYILKMCAAWIEEGKEQRTHHLRLQRLMRELEAEFGALDEPLLLKHLLSKDASSGASSLQASGAAAVSGPSAIGDQID